MQNVRRCYLRISRPARKLSAETSDWITRTQAAEILRLFFCCFYLSLLFPWLWPSASPLQSSAPSRKVVEKASLYIMARCSQFYLEVWKRNLEGRDDERTGRLKRKKIHVEKQPTRCTAKDVCVSNLLPLKRQVSTLFVKNKLTLTAFGRFINTAT